MSHSLFLGALLFLSSLIGASPPGKLGVRAFSSALAQDAGITTRGAPILHVAPTSPAASAGIQSGDVITAVDAVPIASFDELSTALHEHKAGDTVTLHFVRDGQQHTASAKLAAWTGEVEAASFEQAAQFLQKTDPKTRTLRLDREIAYQMWMGGHRLETIAYLEQLQKKYPNNSQVGVLLVENLQRVGDFSAFAKLAVELAQQHPKVSTVQLFRIEALLATGKLEEAEKASAQMAVDSINLWGQWNSITERALTQWSIARLRLGKGWFDPALGRLNDQKWTSDDLRTVQYWREMLGKRDPYRLDPGSKPSTVPLASAKVLLGLAPFQMRGIPISINGHEVPLAIVDTGASHTLVSDAVAAACKLEVGTDKRNAAGSMNFVARAGIIRELKIGDIVLRDVPVSVGSPPPMLMTKAEAALGTDLMYRLGFTIDYPNQQVEVRPLAAKEKDLPAKKPQEWDIPLWTFSDHCMSQAELPGGRFARTLIDSGNFAYTLAWPTWAHRNIESHPVPAKSMFIYALGTQSFMVDGISLGGRTLPPWPVVDMPPVTLGGIDIIDLLMGHDLLGQYRVEVDMRGRKLRLSSPGGALAEPKPHTTIPMPKAK